MEFEYRRFMRVFNRKGHKEAMAYYTHFYPEETRKETLRERLDVVSKLEQEFDIRGGVSLKADSGTILTADETVDHVVSFIIQSADAVRRKDTLPEYNSSWQYESPRERSVA
jgi:hypothetical protein